MTGERTPGLRGRLPAKRDGAKFAIGWVHDYATAPLPAPAYPVDVTSGIRSWGMLGNDSRGDCTFAGREHYKMAKAAAGREPMPAETASELVAEYLAYTHGQDVGAVIADVLLDWYHRGFILAFAPVDHADRLASDAAMAAFHGLYLGGELTPDANERFQNRQPWTVADGQQPDSADGHCFLRVASTGAGPDAMSTNVTWGADQESTAAWDAACVSEAWVIITHEDAAAASLDIAALRADIDALGGTGGHDPLPPPAAAVGPLHGLAALVQEIAARADRYTGRLIEWLHARGF